MSIKYLIYNVVLIVALIILIASFSTVKINDIKIEQAVNPRTHYLVWHPNIPGYYGIEVPSMGLFSIVIMGIGSYIGYVSAFRSKPKSGKYLSLFYITNTNTHQLPIPTITFNRNLVLYNIVTFVSAIGFFILDASKIFLTIGILHNLFELIIAIVIVSGGKFNRIVDYIWPILYMITFGGISIFLKWPIDAIFFKFQGLVLDFSLPIIFTDIFLNTSSRLRGADYSYGGDIYTAAEEEERQQQQLLEQEEESGENHLQRQQQVKEEEILVSPPSASTTTTTTAAAAAAAAAKQRFTPYNESCYKNDRIHHPYQLLLLVVASIVHVFGNLWLTLIPFKVISTIIFEFTYCIAFSVYIFYVYLDINSRSSYPTKRIYLPKFSFAKVIAIFLTCVFLSLLSIRLFISINVENE